jgi:hypothetical protein
MMTVEKAEELLRVAASSNTGLPVAFAVVRKASSAMPKPTPPANPKAMPPTVGISATVGRLSALGLSSVEGSVMALPPRPASNPWAAFMQSDVLGIVARHNFPSCLNRVGREVCATVPFDEIVSIVDSFELMSILQRRKRFGVEVRFYIEHSGCAIICFDVQQEIVFRNDYYNIH